MSWTVGLARRSAAWPVLVVAALGIVAIAGIEPALSSSGGVWPAMGVLAPVAGALAVTALALVSGRDFWRWQHMGRLRRRLDRLDRPAAVSGVDGRLRHANPAMTALAGAAAPDVAARLAGAFDLDAALIYRLAVRARAIGFAFEPVAARQGGGHKVLTVRAEEPDHLVWLVLDASELSGPAARLVAGDYDSAPVAHFHRGADGVVATNARYRALFGEGHELPEGLSGDRLRPGSGTVALTGARGARYKFDVFVIAGRDGRLDIFLDSAQGGSLDLSGKAALGLVPVALMQLDLQGRIVWCNRLASEFFGHEPAPGTPLADVIEPLGRPVDALIADAAGHRREWREMARLPGVGSETFLQITLTPVTLDDGPGLFAVLSDASELRLLEEKFVQSQKMEAVGKLAGGVAHDFNNVLTAISGHSDLLLLGKDAQHPDYSDLMQIRQNTNRAAALVRQLLAFSRKQTLNPVLFSVQDVASDTQYLLNRLIGERITLTLEHGRDLGLVRADQRQLEQALMNLVVNARDAMPEGGVITISTANLGIGDDEAIQGIDIPAGEYVEIRVADSGTGIAPEDLERVFDPFYTTKPQGAGTGLGLSTVYGIVKQSGGFVFAGNRPEGGALFRILLPRAEPDAADRVVLPDPGAAPARRDLTGQGTILLVEDEDPVRAFASRALRLRGYEVIESPSAEAAMEILDDEATVIDVLISDVVMPGMDGPAFAAEARRRRPGLRVIFISGYAEDSFRRNMVGEDFHFLPKPFSLTDLTAKVKDVVGSSGAPDGG